LFFPPNVEQCGSDPAFEEMTLRIDRRIMLPMLFTVMLVKGEEQVTSESQYFAGGLRTGSILSDSQSGSIIFLTIVIFSNVAFLFNLLAINRFLS
jgi:hypothetical protein